MMSFAQRALGSMSAILALVAALPEDVAAKCGLTPTVPELALIINGEKVLDADPEAPNEVFAPELLERAGIDLVPEEILMLNLGCHTEQDEGTGTVRIQHAVNVTTIDALAHSLVRLEGLQTVYRASNGRYAADFSELPELPTLQGVRLTMEVHGNGWTSTARFNNSPVTCHLALGDFASLIPGQTLGQVICTRTPTERN